MDVNIENNLSIWWEEVLEKEQCLKFFFHVTVPAAHYRNKPLSHALVVCEYPRIRKHITRQLMQSPLIPGVKCVEVLPKDEAEMISLLTCLKEGEVLCLENGNQLNSLKKSVIRLIQQSMEQFEISFVLGRGATAQKVVLDLSNFCALVMIEKRNQLEMSIQNCFHNILDVSLLPEEICELEIKAIAYENNMHFEEGAIDMIVRVSNRDFRLAGRRVRWIRDYMAVKEMDMSRISLDNTEHILSLYAGE